MNDRTWKELAIALADANENMAPGPDRRALVQAIMSKADGEAFDDDTAKNAAAIAPPVEVPSED